MEYVDADGIRIGYRIAGDGPPVVLVHGAVSDSRVWQNQLSALADEFSVAAWDAPGCGASSDPPSSFRLAEYADCLASFIEAAGLDRPTVVGHSFGGALALELHVRHPDTSRALVIVGGYAGWAGSLPLDEVDTRLQFALRVADALPGGFDPRSMPGLFSDAMPEKSVATLVEVMSEIRPTATRTMALALAEADLRAVLRQITVPTLLVYGDADARAPVEVADALHAGIAGSQLVMLPGLGHELYLEAPDLFNDTLRAFLHALP